MWRKTAIVFPARAGMSPFVFPRDPVAVRVPRASGDEPLNTVHVAVNGGCSPRERG